MAVRKGSDNWIVLGGSLHPEFQDLSKQHRATLEDLGVTVTPEVIALDRWNAFSDVPLIAPGRDGREPGAAEDEIRRVGSFSRFGSRLGTAQ